MRAGRGVGEQRFENICKGGAARLFARPGIGPEERLWNVEAGQRFAAPSSRPDRRSGFPIWDYYAAALCSVSFLYVVSPISQTLSQVRRAEIVTAGSDRPPALSDS